MILRKTYHINEWSCWDREIHEAIQEFRELTGVCPNILLANENTFGVIDMAAAHFGMENISREGVDSPQVDEQISLSAFESMDCSLRFCIDHALGESAFCLIFDDSPDDGGEPVPEEDNVLGHGVAYDQWRLRKVS